MLGSAAVQRKTAKLKNYHNFRLSRSQQLIAIEFAKDKPAHTVPANVLSCRIAVVISAVTPIAGRVSTRLPITISSAR